MRRVLVLFMLGGLALTGLRPAAQVSTAPAAAQSKLSIDWIFSPEGRSVASVPPHMWLRTGAGLLLDTRQPASSRTFETLDPATGTRRPALDMSRAVASLNAVLPDSGVKDSLPWPAAISEDGRRALYLFKGDIFLLNLEGAQFSRITATEPVEIDADFSPDGTTIAFVRDHDLYVYDIDAKQERRLTHDGSDTLLNGTLTWVYWEEIFGRRDTAYWWSPDSRAIAYLQTDQSPVDVSHFVDFEPIVARVIRQRYPQAGDPNPRVRAGIVAAAGGATTWVQFPADRPFEYLVRLKWLPDSRRVSVETMTRDHQQLDLYFADRGTGQSTHVLTETDPGWVNVNDDLYFLKDGHFLWGSERTGFMHLYRYTMDGRLVNAVTSGPWAAVSAGGGVFWLRQTVTGIDEAADWIYFTTNRDESTERQLYRVKSDGSGLTRITKEPGTHSVSMPAGAGAYLDTYSNIRTLPSLSLHAGDGAERAMVAPARPALLAPFNVQYPELSRIATPDQFQMPAQILRPVGFRADRKYPVVLYIYGGPSAPTVANAWQQKVLVDQLLLDEGYVAVQVDNRSATAISKALENTILKRSGEPETEDLLAAVRWLKAQPWVDPDRVGVWGWSGGGTMTLNLLTRSTEFKAGIAVAPVTDWRYYDTFWTEAFMKLPKDNPKGYEDTSLVRRADKLHGRLLIAYGTYDDNVHPQNEQAFVNALIAAAKPVDMMVYPMRQHGIVDTPATKHLYRKMLEWWKGNL